MNNKILQIVSLTLGIINIPLMCIIIFMCIDIKSEIITNSVHPIHGEYPQKRFNCWPWDSCSFYNQCLKSNDKVDN